MRKLTPGYPGMDEAPHLAEEIAKYGRHLEHTSCCAVHNAPAYMPGPCDCGASAVPDALRAARLALCASHNVLATDRPDLPRSKETGWTTDHRREIALIDQALAALGLSIDTGRGCADRSSGPSTEPV